MGMRASALAWAASSACIGVTVNVKKLTTTRIRFMFNTSIRKPVAGALVVCVACGEYNTHGWIEAQHLGNSFTVPTVSAGRQASTNSPFRAHGVELQVGRTPI